MFDELKGKEGLDFGLLNSLFPATSFEDEINLEEFRVEKVASRKDPKRHLTKEAQESLSLARLLGGFNENSLEEFRKNASASDIVRGAIATAGRAKDKVVGGVKGAVGKASKAGAKAYAKRKRDQALKNPYNFIFPGMTLAALSKYQRPDNPYESVGDSLTSGALEGGLTGAAAFVGSRGGRNPVEKLTRGALAAILTNRTLRAARAVPNFSNFGPTLFDTLLNREISRPQNMGNIGYNPMDYQGVY